ncbi:hypothetical protein Nepgr_017770 [Nepenthes gracilis]|uniref:Uncharacterized protein n=1 Tax=Nepenthes gracilis TaxID=150966 RepID=A0AAD3XTF3_NEPGR|nr:hypothetical protein Nepgr_017770 [Nepenthes gracilis]
MNGEDGDKKVSEEGVDSGKSDIWHIESVANMRQRAGFSYSSSSFPSIFQITTGYVYAPQFMLIFMPNTSKAMRRPLVELQAAYIMAAFGNLLLGSFCKKLQLLLTKMTSSVLR